VMCGAEKIAVIVRDAKPVANQRLNL
jgi:hypothetical protein